MSHTDEFRTDEFRSAVGQPACARALVSASRAKTAAGLRVRYCSGGMDVVLTVQSVYPLFDGSGWAVLFEGGHGVRAEGCQVVEVSR